MDFTSLQPILGKGIRENLPDAVKLVDFVPQFYNTVMQLQKVLFNSLLKSRELDPERRRRDSLGLSYTIHRSLRSHPAMLFSSSLLSSFNNE